MSSIVKQLIQKKLCRPPSFLEDNMHYEVIMGSYAYGVSGDTSDSDIYGFCIPPKDMIFPHIVGEILDFGTHKKRFSGYQEHHIKDENGQEYDLDIYNIVKYFDLCMNCNPNMIDSLFTPERCVLFITKVGQLVRENRKLFLNKKAWHTFKGYSFAQMHKIDSKVAIGKRKETVEKYGWDLKYGYHCVRLMCEIEMILQEHDLILDARTEQLKAIRRGDVPLEDLKKWFFEKETSLEKLYHESTLPYNPREEEIKQLLLNCLEMHYGSLDKYITNANKLPTCIREIELVLQKYK